MNQHLFVYGTLMPTAGSRLGRHQRSRLARESRRLGPARIQARLYDLGRYPGLVDSVDSADIVHGEVVALEDAASSLHWLDAYEGIYPGEPDRSEYRREQRTVRLSAPGLLAAAREVTAWVYIYARDPAPYRRIEDGRWQC